MANEILKGYLSDYAMNFLENCKQKIDNIQEDDDKNNDPTSPEVMRKIIIIAENFSLILKHLKDGRRAQIEFMERYPSWNKNRREIITKLKEIGNAINNDRFNCNVSRIVSTIASLAGGGLIAASAVLLPVTGGLSASLGIAGGALIVTGNASNLGTSITETIKDKTNVAEAQKIIEEENELFEKFGSWMENSETLSKAQSEVLEIDILKDVISSVKKLVDKGMKIQNIHERNRYIEKKIDKIVKCSKKKIKISVMGIKTLLSLLVGMFVLMSSNDCRILFDCANITVRALTGSVVLADELFGVAELAIIGGAGAACSEAVARAAVRGAFAAIGIGLDIAGIALTSIDIHKGSLSSHAQKILNIANGLEKQVDVLENVYNDMANSKHRSRA